VGKLNTFVCFFFLFFYFMAGGYALRSVIRLKWPLSLSVMACFLFIFFVSFFFCCLPLIYCCRLCRGDADGEGGGGTRRDGSIYVCVIFWDGMGNLWIRRDGRLCPRPPWCEEELHARCC
jgi:hypothetical protein